MAANLRSEERVDLVREMVLAVSVRAPKLDGHRCWHDGVQVRSSVSNVFSFFSEPQSLLSDLASDAH
jgi:hypothetical protein